MLGLFNSVGNHDSKNWLLRRKKNTKQTVPMKEIIN